MQLPKDDGDYPLALLIATKRALFRCMEDPELEDARAILSAIDEALKTEAARSRAE